MCQKAPGWTAPHAKQWAQSLEDHVFPIIGALPVGEIDTELVLHVLEPIWTTVPETAARVRGRIENVLDAAKVRGYRTGDNPARWKGHLDHILPRRDRVAATVHHHALPWSDVPAFIAELRRHDEPDARALELLILTASRSAEVLQAPWPEFDLEQRLWTIPKERMKAAREHRIPLSDAAMAILERQAPIRIGDYVFGGRSGGPCGTANRMRAFSSRLSRYRAARQEQPGAPAEAAWSTRCDGARLSLNIPRLGFRDNRL